jgi:hypothetical protein
LLTLLTLPRPQLAFSAHINNCLENDSHANRHLPLGLENSQDLYQKTDDGLIYWSVPSLCLYLSHVRSLTHSKLINLAEPGTIDERALNKKPTLNVYQKTENLVS